MDQTFLMMVSLIVSLSNQVRELQAQIAAISAAGQNGSDAPSRVLDAAETTVADIARRQIA